MGVVGEAIEKVAGPELGTGIRSALTSSESMLSDTPAGKWAYDTIQKYLDRVKIESASTYANDVNLYKNQGINLTPKDHEQLMNTARNSAARRNDTMYFGLNRNKLTQAVSMAAQQKNIIHATEVGDYASNVLREEKPKTFKSPTTGKLTDWRQAAGIGPSPYRGSGAVEQSVHGALAYTFLGRVAIPHTMQNLNVALTLGWKSWAKAWDEVNYLGRTPQASEYLGAMFDETYRDFKLINQGKDTWLNKFIHMPGFSMERKKFLAHAAAAGKWAGIDAGKEFAQTGSKASLERLKFLRLDPAKILAQGGKLTQDDIEQAALASADENMFLGPGRTPHFWSMNPDRRFMFLYKNFQFRQGKLIKDTIARSLRSGPGQAVATLVTLGTAFPIAGHIIGDLENLATGRSPEDRSMQMQPTGNEFIDDRIDDLSHMAAFGIWYGLFRAVARHRMTDYTSGPLISLLADIGNSLYQGGKGNFKPAIKSVARRVPVVGPAVAAHIDDIEDWAKSTIP